MKWKILFKSLFYSLIIVILFGKFIEYSVDFLGYHTFSIELVADILPPLILLVLVIFIGLTTILYQVMRL